MSGSWDFHEPEESRRELRAALPCSPFGPFVDKLDIVHMVDQCRVAADPDLHLAQVVGKLRGEPGFVLTRAGDYPVLRHETLVAPDVHIEEPGIAPASAARSLRLRRRPANTLYPGISPKIVRKVHSSARYSFFQRVDHLMVPVRIRQVEEKGRVVVTMDFFYRAAVNAPQVHAVPVGRIKDPHWVSPLRCFLQPGPGVSAAQ